MPRPTSAHSGRKAPAAQPTAPAGRIASSNDQRRLLTGWPSSRRSSWLLISESMHSVTSKAPAAELARSNGVRLKPLSTCIPITVSTACKAMVPSDSDRLRIGAM